MGATEPASFTILLVRHAQPEPPIPGSTESADNERPLVAAGRRAAEALAGQLREFPISAVYSSPYRRARETVEPIAATLGIDVRIVADLRERRLAPSPLPEDEFFEVLRKARADPSFALPGGESTDDVRARAFGAFDQICAESATGVAVAASHGGLISIVRWSLGAELTIEQALASPMPSVFVLDRLSDRWRIEPLAG